MNLTFAHVQVMILLFVSKYCLTIEFRPPKITYPNNTDNLYYTAGRQVHIKCTSNGIPPPVFKWLENDLEINSTQQLNYNETTGVLNIGNFSVRYQTLYRCIATNHYEGDNNQTVLVSTMSPKIHLWQMHLEKFASNIDVVENVTDHEYLVLPCGDTKASIAPKLRYVWYNANDSTSINLGQGRLYVDMFGSLHFTHLQMGDGNIQAYACGISTRLSDGLPYIHLGTNHIVNVFTTRSPPGPTGIRPWFRYSNTVVIGCKNASATLECVFSGYGTTLYPQHLWRDSQGVEYASSAKYNFSQDGRQMTIIDLQEDDEKFYFCVGKNAAGEAASGVFLNVTSAPFFPNGPPTDKVGIQNASVEILCDASSVKEEKPPAPPVWIINSQKMLISYDTNKYQLSSDSKLLTIKKLRKPLDVMCVQCQVENDVNVVTATACVTVILPITITKKPPAVQKIVYGDTIDLTVQATTDPSMNLSYRWFIPNVTFDESTIPIFMSLDRKTKVAFINTSRLPVEDYKLMAGIYNITVFHLHESQVIKTEICQLDLQLDTRHKEEEEEQGLSIWLVSGIISLVALLLLIAFILCLLIRKPDKAMQEEEGGEGEKKPPVEAIYIIEVRERESSEDFGSEV